MAPAAIGPASDVLLMTNCSELSAPARSVERAPAFIDGRGRESRRRLLLPFELAAMPSLPFRRHIVPRRVLDPLESPREIGAIRLSDSSGNSLPRGSFNKQGVPGIAKSRVLTDTPVGILVHATAREGATDLSFARDQTVGVGTRLGVISRVPSRQELDRSRSQESSGAECRDDLCSSSEHAHRHMVTLRGYWSFSE